MPEMAAAFPTMQQDPVLAKIPILLISGVPTEKFVTQALAISTKYLNKPSVRATGSGNPISAGQNLSP